MDERDLLDRILVSKRHEIEQLKLESIDGQHRSHRHEACSFAEALRTPGLSIIAEIKRRSPSLGDLYPDLDPVDIARAYEMAGASAISVLTDGPFFGGSFEDIFMVKEAVSIPVLCKDFIIDPIQLETAKHAGADAALLIVRLLEESQLAELLLFADSLGLDALVETHTKVEIDVALRAGATIIGVNCRDLDSLELNPDHHLRMASRLPAGTIGIAESGMKTGNDLTIRREAGYEAVLIGSHFMSAQDPGMALAALVDQCTMPTSIIAGV
ncbi:indole-3-glycerol phosphate synthase TrpC [bacterium]|nr:indole-3-glycerol phosphate synthase TrpC [bacterium]